MRGKGLSRALAGAPGSAHGLEPGRTISRSVAGGRSGARRSSAQVTALADPQGAPPPRVEARGTSVPEVPLTSDAMVGRSSSSRSLDPPVLEDKTRLTTSSASQLGSRAGSASSSRTTFGRARTVGRWSWIAPWSPAFSGPARPPSQVAAHSPLPGLSVYLSPANPRGFSRGECVSISRACPRLLVAAAPILGSLAR